MTRRILEVDPGYGGRSYTGALGYKKQKASAPAIKEFSPPTPPPSLPRDDDYQEPIPLELLPVIRTLTGYGRRAHSLGALRGARALERVVEGLMPHVRKFPELVDVILEAKHEAEAIRSEATRGADGEQHDGSHDPDEDDL